MVMISLLSSFSPGLSLVYLLVKSTRRLLVETHVYVVVDSIDRIMHSSMSRALYGRVISEFAGGDG